MVDFTLKNANILIIDDKEANIDILVALLEIEGYTNIKTITDSRLAVGLFKSFNPDLILLDLMMPHLTGYEILKQLKALVPPDTYLPILVLTADISKEAKQRALTDGAKDFLSKPFDLAEVGLRIKNLLFARYLQQQLQNQNQILEKRVKERTLELENINIELIAARDKAEESDYLKTAFLNNISHEIRTPFNGILGFLSLLQDKDLPGSDRDEYIGIINESSFRLMNTINHIVEISQIQARQMKLTLTKVNINLLVDKLLNQFRSAADTKGLEFIVSNELSEALVSIYTDSTKLQSILSNLIDNSIKFTKEGSIELGIRNNSYYLEFFVKDTGTGIAASKHKTIFERFMQADVSNTRLFEGSGLGLSIAKAHAEMLGGSIWLESKVGQGSTFYVQIPLKVQKIEKASSAVEMPALKTPEPQPRIILVAEDDDVNFNYANVILSKANYQVLRAYTGVDAIELCRTHDNIDLIIMDIKMPSLDGYAATAEIRGFKPGIPIVALTAYALHGESAKALQAGCDDFLVKPIKKEELLEVIRKHM